ncbi:CHAP domain-containing protein [Lentzea sp. NPDC102401]|uniref:CHAP domain-containing protein n=1 Tax=Lentzea sp. NPDC102401 TaxID=3364128 RepID=UPI003806FD7E
MTIHTTGTGASPRRAGIAAAAGLLAALIGLAPLTAAASAIAEPAPIVVAQNRATGQTTDHNLARDYYGQCTWGAYEKFHENTDLWPLIGGNAKDMNDNAAARGWTVVLDAEPRSLVVFEPGVHGADPTYGHVSWVDEVFIENGVKKIRVTETNAGGALGEFTSRVLPDVVGMSYILAP